MEYENDGFDPTPYDRILSGVKEPEETGNIEESDDVYMDVQAPP